MKKLSPLNRLVTLTMIGVSISVLTVGSVSANSDSAKSTQTSGRLPVSMTLDTPSQQEAGEEALQAIGQARESIAKQDLQAAAAETKRAETLLDGIAAILPTAKARQTINDAKNKTDATPPDWISIYNSLDETTLFMPAKTAKSKIDTARQAMEKGDTQAAQQALDAALIDIQYSEIDIPLTNTRSFVHQANAALQAGDATAADKALQAAENSVVYISSAVDQPLYQTHQSLWQALNSLKNGSQADAKDAIDKALSQLEQGSKSTDSAISQAADALLEEGKALRDKLEEPPDTDLTGDLERLGQHLEAWAERAMNYSNVRWSGMSHYSPLTIDLLEGRFHLQNVIIDQTTGHEPKAAKDQLLEVQHALDKAMQEADEYWTDPSYKQQISDMQTQIGQLLEMPDTIPKAIKDGQLSDIQQKLQTIINAL